MKTRKLINQFGRRRRTHWLGVLIASIFATASATKADQAVRETPRKPPTRLPAVNATVKAGGSHDHASLTNSGLDLVRYNGAVASAVETVAPASVKSESIASPISAEGEGRSGNKSDITAVSARQSHAPSRWLRSTTSTAASEVARRLLNQASREYNVGAWLSAETTAWDALRWAAEGVDLEDRENARSLNSASTLPKLKLARNAIREARDFAGKYGVLDAEAIARMARSHITDVLDDEPTEDLTETDASDRYLDEARVALASIASRNVEAAQTMDLLAAIYLSRAEPKTLPSATALCLRRAALQGQPDNASLASRLGMHLADVGLFGEARWVLEHSLSMEADQEATDTLARVLRRTGHGEDAARLIAATQDRAHAQLLTQTDGQSESRPKIPEIIQLSPADFAALSKPVIPFSRKSIPTAQNQTRTGPASSDTSSTSATLASTKTNVTQNGTGDSPLQAEQSTNAMTPGEEDKPGMVRRFIHSLRRVW